MTTKTIDKSNMKKVILDFPKQFEKALEFSKNIKVGGKFENVVICGIGGSTLAASIFSSWLNSFEKNIPLVYVHRAYGLPSLVTEKSLIICISYSGDTEEPVSALEEAIQKKLTVVGIATGGKVLELCKKHNLPIIIIPPGIQPRCATGYLFTSLFKILANSGIIEDKSNEISEMAEELKKLNLEKEGKKIAKKMVNKIPIIYASNRLKTLARAWKIKLNENSKIPAFFNYFPELNHNEMVGFTNAELIKNFYIIILRDKNDHLRNLKRMDLFAKLMKTKGINVEFVYIKEGNFLLKIFSTLILGDWASYYLALEYQIDPTPVKIVEEFKKKLKE